MSSVDARQQGEGQHLIRFAVRLRFRLRLEGGSGLGITTQDRKAFKVQRSASD